MEAEIKEIGDTEFDQALKRLESQKESSALERVEAENESSVLENNYGQFQKRLEVMEQENMLERGKGKKLSEEVIMLKGEVTKLQMMMVHLLKKVEEKSRVVKGDENKEESVSSVSLNGSVEGDGGVREGRGGGRVEFVNRGSGRGYGVGRYTGRGRGFGGGSVMNQDGMGSMGYGGMGSMGYGMGGMPNMIGMGGGGMGSMGNGMGGMPNMIGGRCFQWAETGGCNYGSDCRFRHIDG